ncbi:DUF4231 domain-containing protein [Streptomyces sp. NPDC050504]|uniref:DUF4231 domain-containing protein n=1 Tax=Streptomyces sp. NPDC050504 TaxID=3365618 RepID=UPI0037A64EF3
MVFRNADLPTLFHHADAVAIARQREAVNTTRTQLLLLVAGAALAAPGWQGEPSGPERVLSALSVLAYAGALATSYLANRRRAKSHWQLNRSAAEFIKSLCWRYAVHGAPFGTASAHPEALFAARLEEGLQELRKVGWSDPRESLAEAADDSDGVITDSMRMLRAKSFGVRRDTYVRDRLIEQRKWYHRRREVSRRASALWSAAIALCTVLALLFGLLHTFGTAGPVHVAGTLSAAAAACIAWSEMRRHQPLLSAHSLVEKDLEAMQVAMETSITERQWPSAVFETERLCSPQHTDWLAKLGT